ncbi:protein of unknown function [Candidatus Hydrogenisulfobacillus filiaventi]|uniref:Uncharacterized protein n=1 Tax=Candidatus Hydrogenisulfobacillus filiaventi TaxID=2707344 RepID=A0A6F8ZDB3_9FIRM|nr:hypothetical protein [Bacillota bacterium]CAB1127921.1 protein of unknown function [Candidatus Hydrogenisulfobacillus filiaventi]
MAKDRDQDLITLVDDEERDVDWFDVMRSWFAQDEEEQEEEPRER